MNILKVFVCSKRGQKEIFHITAEIWVESEKFNKLEDWIFVVEVFWLFCNSKASDGISRHRNGRAFYCAWFLSTLLTTTLHDTLSSALDNFNCCLCLHSRNIFAMLKNEKKSKLERKIFSSVPTLIKTSDEPLIDSISNSTTVSLTDLKPRARFSHYTQFRCLSLIKVSYTNLNLNMKTLTIRNSLMLDHMHRFLLDNDTSIYKAL